LNRYEYVTRAVGNYRCATDNKNNLVFEHLGAF